MSSLLSCLGQRTSYKFDICESSESADFMLTYMIIIFLYLLTFIPSPFPTTISIHFSSQLLYLVTPVSSLFLSLLL